MVIFLSNDFNRFEYAMADIDISRSVFDLSHSHKTSFNVGSVIPIFCEEVLPGDTWSVDTTKVVRVQPLVSPVMDNLYLDTYYFFVPNRLIWDHWINFMGENTSSAWHDETEYSVPQLKIPLETSESGAVSNYGFKAGTIADYLGVPVGQGALETISALPFRAYACICNDWFVDKNLQNPVFVPKGDSLVEGANDNTQVNVHLGGTPFIASKYKDYFTTCLPEPQRGAPATVSLGGTAPLTAIGYKSAIADNLAFVEASPFNYLNDMTPGTPVKFATTNSQTFVMPSSTYDLYEKAGDGLYGKSDTSTLSSQKFAPSNLVVDLDHITADLSSATPVSVNELRQAFAIQRYLERSARAGSRYIESIEAFFGVTSPDARMQRSEYLGGSRLPLNVSDVTVTSSTEDALVPTGGVAGKSLTGETNSDFTKSFTEHGYIIGVCVCRYKHTYQNGLRRAWSRKTLFDYYNPVFANLGEMPVKNKEIYLGSSMDPAGNHNEETFGFQEAWADYRYINNRVSGEMRSNHDTSLDIWHFADDYNALPSLSDTWIREDKSPVDRALAVTSNVSNQLIGDFYFECSVARPMPLYSIPGLIDHN